MADDKLNQSDIDALIARVRGGNNSQPAPQTEAVATSEVDMQGRLNQLGITDIDLKGLTKLFKTSIEASTEVLRSITQKNVTVESIQEIKVAGGKELSTMIDPPYIATKVDYIVGLRGLDLLLMKQSDMNNLMTLQFQSMGYEPDENDTDFMMSASNEVMNQMMGNASNKLGNELDIFIDISTPDSKIVEPAEDGSKEIPFLKEEALSYVYTTFKLNIEGQVTGDLIKVLDTDFIDELRTIMHKGDYLAEWVDKKEPTPEDNQPINTSPLNEEVVDLKQTSPSYIESHPDLDYESNYIPENTQQYSLNQKPQFEQSSNIVHDNSVEVKKYQLPFISSENTIQHEIASTSRIKSVEVEMTVELGRTKMTVKDILALNKGSIVELSRLSGEHLDLYCNGTLIAKGEVVVIKDNFAFRVLSIVEQDYR